MADDRDSFAPKRTPTVMESGAVGKGCLIGIAGAVILLILIAMGVSQYNGLIGKQEGTKKFWQEIDNQYKRRNDLIPNLVETVKGSASFEQSTLTEVTEARASVGRITVQPSPTDQAAAQNYIQAQQGLGSALQRLLLVAENYPDLKSTGRFADLQSQLEGTENRIAVARRDYLDSAQAYNTAIRQFPANLIPGFDRAAELPVTEAERAVPKVDFGAGSKPK